LPGPRGKKGVPGKSGTPGKNAVPFYPFLNILEIRF
ncbi:hypothetical protein CEXT_709931, partial [Caerostris extrusa]